MFSLIHIGFQRQSEYYNIIEYQGVDEVMLQDFARAIKGRVILPNNQDYDTARKLFYGGFDRKPKAIVRVKDASDVQKTIAFTKENNYELAVRSGGHSVAGYSVIDDSIVIDFTDMRQLEIDTELKTAWAEPGLTSGEVTNELDKHNLVLGFGDTGSVGSGGITLGGGVGYLVRKFGLTIDNLLAAEIVTADGKILRIDKDNHPDLFWAIRGGGGNFGVVTKFKYQLHDLAECYGGMMFLPATAEVIAGFVDIAQKAPDELSTIINIMPTPPMPGIDKDQIGKLSVIALMVYAGDPKEGERVIAPVRALAKPIVDMVKPMRYKEIYFPEDESYHPKAVGLNLHLNTIDFNLAKIIAHLNSIDAPMRALQLRVLGGAMSRVPIDETAYANRKAPIMANIAAFYGTEDERKARQQWAESFAKLLDQGNPAVYVNFLGLNEKDRIRDAYPGKTWERLVEVKKRYDPANFFHNNANISPTPVRQIHPAQRSK